MRAQTRFGFTGETATPMLPSVPVGSPGLRLMFVQFSPASVDLNNPLPAPPDTSFHGVRYACHTAAYKTLESDGSIERSTAPAESLTNRTFLQLFPPFSD